MRSLFTSHPASVGESYGEHLATAATFSFRLLAASAACFVHGLFPFLFGRAASRIVAGLHLEMVVNRQRPVEGETSEAGLACRTER